MATKQNCVQEELFAQLELLFGIIASQNLSRVFMSFKLSGFFIWASFLFVVNAYAHSVVLFTDGRLDANYCFRLAAVEVGDILVFSDSETFRTYGLLGKGLSDAIFDIGEGKALRVPQYLFRRPPEPYVRHFHTGYFKLKKYGVAIPEVYLEESSKKKYIVVSKENVVFKLSSFRHEIISIAARSGGAAARDLINALVEFAKTTAYFKHIADFRGDNIVWTGERWLLLDWDAEHQLAQSIDDETVFNNSISRAKIVLPLEIKDEIDSAIKNKRREIFEEKD